MTKPVRHHTRLTTTHVTYRTYDQVPQPVRQMGEEIHKKAQGVLAQLGLTEISYVTQRGGRLLGTPRGLVLTHGRLETDTQPGGAHITAFYGNRGLDLGSQPDNLPGWQLAKATLFNIARPRALAWSGAALRAPEGSGLEAYGDVDYRLKLWTPYAHNNQPSFPVEVSVPSNETSYVDASELPDDLVAKIEAGLGFLSLLPLAAE